MGEEESQFPFFGIANFLSLSQRLGYADEDFSQRLRDQSVIYLVFWKLVVIEGEAYDVGNTIGFSVLPIKTMNGLVINKGDIDFVIRFNFKEIEGGCHDICVPLFQEVVLRIESIIKTQFHCLYTLALLTRAR